MRFWIMKSGLEIFDVARAYGLAALLSYADEAQSASPIVSDAGAVYCVDLPDGKLSASRLTSADNSGWLDAFAIGDFRDPLAPQWKSLFVTDTAKFKESKCAAAKRLLENHLNDVLEQAKQPGLVADFDGGETRETLTGGLDPVAFKGLRGRTRGQYTEGRTRVDQLNWALACLGGALAGRFIYQRYQRTENYFIIYPVPESVEWTDFREVRKETYGERLRRYLSVQNTAAHYSVVLAEHLRSRAASGLASNPHYSNLLYFSLFKTGNQWKRGQWKPGGGGRLNLQPLLDMALQRPHDAEDVFKVWLYLFRRGSARGNEDLALAITDLVMHPTLDSYERHVRVFARHIAQDIAQGAKTEFQYSEQSLKEVTVLVSS